MEVKLGETHQIDGRSRLERGDFVEKVSECSSGPGTAGLHGLKRRSAPLPSRHRDIESAQRLDLQRGH